MKRSTVVLKYSMAVSGLIMLGYLLVHMYGNLKFFQGQEYFDSYLEGLDDILYPYLPHEGALWIIRVVLTVALVVHVYAAVTLWRRNKAAAGFVGNTRYHTKQNKTGVQRSYASFTMRWGGVTIALFIVFHILNLTTNTIHPGGKADTAYGKLHNSFDGQPLIWLVYVLAMVAVGFHLWHGFWSAFTTLGQNHSSTRKASIWNSAAIGIAAIITIGFLAPPTSILFFGLGG